MTLPRLSFPLFWGCVPGTGLWIGLLYFEPQPLWVLVLACVVFVALCSLAVCNGLAEFYRGKLR